MPKRMPNLAGTFSVTINDSLALANAGEQARVLLLNSHGHIHPLTVLRLERLYEMAYLRLFLGWETFLEQSFFRYLCGYENAIGVEPLVPGMTYFSKLSDSIAAVNGRRQYILWHNPTAVCRRVQQFVANGRHYQVLQSALADVERYAAIRHRIAHSQDHARQEFDSATMNLSVRRYPGSRAGTFLRDWDASGVQPVRWLEKISTELLSLAYQITP